VSPPPILKVMEKEILVKELERIFTIDGKGRPAKCKMFLRLLEDYEDIEIFSAIRDMSERKF
jgi:hypothetical protein